MNHNVNVGAGEGEGAYVITVGGARKLTDGQLDGDERRSSVVVGECEGGRGVVNDECLRAGRRVGVNGGGACLFASARDGGRINNNKNNTTIIINNFAFAIVEGARLVICGAGMNGGGAWLLAIARDGGRNNNSNVKVCTGKEEGASMVVCGARKWTDGRLDGGERRRSVVVGACERGRRGPCGRS